MKRPKPAAPAPRPQPRVIRAKPWEANPQDHLEHILHALTHAAEAHQFCNLSPADCVLLMGSIKATTKALSSAECVVRQVARDHYGSKVAKTMTVKDFADRQGYDS